MDGSYVVSRTIPILSFDLYTHNIFLYLTSSYDYSRVTIFYYYQSGVFEMAMLKSLDLSSQGKNIT